MIRSVLCGIALAAPAAAQSSYQVARLDEVYALTNLSERPVNVSALNDEHQVTGEVLREVGGQVRAFPFFWGKNDGVLLLDLPSGHTGASGADITDEGEIVGFLSHPDFGTLAYRWRTNTGSGSAYALVPAVEDRLPLAFNGRLMVGGPFFTNGSPWIYDVQTGQLIDLVVGGEVIPGVNHCTDVNSRGEVVGTISTRLPSGAVSPRAFRWRRPQHGYSIRQPELLRVPRSDWLWSDAAAINEKSDVAGFLFDLDDQSVAFWDGDSGAFTDLGLAPSQFVTNAQALNSARQIVGWSPNDHPNGLDTPFLWQEGVFHDLNDLLATPLPGSDVVFRAHDISESGVILAELFQPFQSVRFELVLLMPLP